MALIQTIQTLNANPPGTTSARRSPRVKHLDQNLTVLCQNLTVLTRIRLS